MDRRAETKRATREDARRRLAAGCAYWPRPVPVRLSLGGTSLVAFGPTRGPAPGEVIEPPVPLGWLDMPLLDPLEPVVDGGFAVPLVTALPGARLVEASLDD
jgi:hypothetical protein